MGFGVYTFVETRRDPLSGEPVGLEKTFVDLMEPPTSAGLRAIP